MRGPQAEFCASRIPRLDRCAGRRQVNDRLKSPQNRAAGPNARRACFHSLVFVRSWRVLAYPARPSKERGTAERWCPSPRWASCPLSASALRPTTDSCRPRPSLKGRQTRAMENYRLLRQAVRLRGPGPGVPCHGKQEPSLAKSTRNFPCYLFLLH